MDINDLRTLVTLLSFACFIGIVAWACSPRRSEAFREAALLPLEDDSPYVPASRETAK